MHNNQGLSATARGSIVIPEHTKNTGISNEYPTMSSRCSTASLNFSGTRRRKINPAANAPNTTSNSNTAATAMSTPSITVWFVAPALRTMARAVHGKRNRTVRGMAATTRAITKNAAKTIAVTHVLRADNNNAIAKMGKISPIAPCTNNDRPTGVCSTCCCFMMGMSVPTAVDVNAMASTTAVDVLWGCRSTHAPAKLSPMHTNQVVALVRPSLLRIMAGLIS